MMRHLPVAGLVMASLIGFAGLLRAIGGGPPPEVLPLSITEQHFLARAAQACAAEAVLAKLAGSRTQNQRVKDLATAVARDHEATKKDLAEIARKMDVTIPEPSVAQNAARERLAGLRGAEFDRAWVWQTAKNHAAAVALFRDGIRGTNDELKALAESRLGMLATHLNGARELDHTFVARLGPNPARSRR
jgi:putative membrane protein